MFKSYGAVIAVAQEAFSLYSSANEARERRQILGLLRDIHRKVDSLINLQRDILDEIQALRVHFRADLRTEFLFSLQSEFASVASRIAVVAAMEGQVLDRRLLPQVAEIVPAAEAAADRLLFYGPAAFPSAVAAIGCLTSLTTLMAELGANRQSVRVRERENIRQWISIIESWSDRNHNWSLTSGIASFAREIDAIALEIGNTPRTVELGWKYLGRRRSRGDERMLCKYWQWETLTILGDIESGFSDEITAGRTRRDDCFIIRDPKSKVSGSDDDVAIDIDRYDPNSPFEIPLMYNSSATEVMELDFLKSFDSNNHAITDNMNQLRIRRVDLITQKNALEKFIEIVDNTKESLRVRIA